MRLASLLTSRPELVDSYTDPSKTAFYLTYSEATQEWNARELKSEEGVIELLLDKEEDSSLEVIRRGLLREREVSLIPRLNDLLIRINKIIYYRLKIFRLTFEPTCEQIADSRPVLFKAKIKQWNGFSNFFPTLLHHKDSLEDRIYPSLETAYQALKFQDPTKRKLIAEIEDPLEAMKTAKSLETPDSVAPGWNEGLKERIMQDLLRSKFSQNQDLQRRLLDTRDRLLVEHNSNPFWGDGTHGRAKHGNGLNKLGQLLMNLREQFIKLQTSPHI